MSVEFGKIQPIQQIQVPAVFQETDAVREKYNSNVFVQFLDAAMGMYQDSNKLELEVDQKQIDFVTGKSDDLLEVMIAQEKAYTSLQFTVQVTSKVLEGYKELMRMSI